MVFPQLTRACQIGIVSVALLEGIPVRRTRGGYAALKLWTSSNRHVTGNSRRTRPKPTLSAYWGPTQRAPREYQDLDQLGFEAEKPLNFTATLALVTIFQQLERYTDQQAADAIQRRADWKYALHLPLAYSGFDPSWLCSFVGTPWANRPAPP